MDMQAARRGAGGEVGDMGERGWDAFQEARERFFAALAEAPPPAPGGDRDDDSREGRTP